MTPPPPVLPPHERPKSAALVASVSLFWLLPGILGLAETLLAALIAIPFGLVSLLLWFLVLMRRVTSHDVRGMTEDRP